MDGVPFFGAPSIANRCQGTVRIRLLPRGVGNNSGGMQGVRGFGLVPLAAVWFSVGADGKTEAARAGKIGGGLAGVIQFQGR